jgi:hypothetical protein
VYSNLSLNTGTSFNFPMRRVIQSGSRLGIKGRGRDDLIFGNVYTGEYFKPLGKTGDVLEELNFLPLHDYRPLFIFLGWYGTATRPKNGSYASRRPPAGPTALGLNLHFTMPLSYDDDEPLREPGGSDSDIYLPFGEDESDPVGTREIAITIVNVIKQKLGLAIGEDMRDNIFQEQGVDIDEAESKYLQLTSEEAMQLQKIVSTSVMSKQGLDWGAITAINNRYFRMFKVIMRRYSLKRLTSYTDIDHFAPKQKKDILLGDGFIRLAGGGKWNQSDIAITLRTALQQASNSKASERNSWRKALNNVIQERRKRYKGSR